MIRAVTLKRLVTVFIGMALLTAVLWRVEVRAAVVTAAIALVAFVLIVAVLCAIQVRDWREKRQYQQVVSQLGGAAADRYGGN